MNRKYYIGIVPTQSIHVTFVHRLQYINGSSQFWCIDYRVKNCSVPILCWRELPDLCTKESSDIEGSAEPEQESDKQTGGQSADRHLSSDAQKSVDKPKPESSEPTSGQATVRHLLSDAQGNVEQQEPESEEKRELEAIEEQADTLIAAVAEDDLVAGKQSAYISNNLAQILNFSG